MNAWSAVGDLVLKIGGAMLGLKLLFFFIGRIGRGMFDIDRPGGKRDGKRKGKRE